MPAFAPVLRPDAGGMAVGADVCEIAPAVGADVEFTEAFELELLLLEVDDKLFEED